MNHSTFLTDTAINQINCTKSDLETAIVPKFESTIFEESNVEAALSTKFDSNEPEMEDSLQMKTAILNSDENIEQNNTDFELAVVSKSRYTSQLLTSKKTAKQDSDVNTQQTANSLSLSLTSVNTASILERTRPDDKNSGIATRSTCVIHRDRVNEFDCDNIIHEGTTKRSTYLIPHLKYERNIADDFRVMSMDLWSSSSCQSKTITTYATDDDVVKTPTEKRKVTSTRFPSRRTLEKLEEQELAR